MIPNFGRPKKITITETSGNVTKQMVFEYDQIETEPEPQQPAIQYTARKTHPDFIPAVTYDAPRNQQPPPTTVVYGPEERPIRVPPTYQQIRFMKEKYGYNYWTDTKTYSHPTTTFPRYWPITPMRELVALARAKNTQNNIPLPQINTDIPLGADDEFEENINAPAPAPETILVHRAKRGRTSVAKLKEKIRGLDERYYHMKKMELLKEIRRLKRAEASQAPAPMAERINDPNCGWRPKPATVTPEWKNFFQNESAAWVSWSSVYKFHCDNVDDSGDNNEQHNDHITYYNYDWDEKNIKMELNIPIAEAIPMVKHYYRSEEEDGNE